ncbi:SemiSWEET family sugar transporter [Niabella aquatica]
MQTITIIGIIASACTAISLLPQLIKTIKEKKASDISYWVLIILIIGLVFWVVYGIMLKDPIIITANTISLVINISLMTLNLLYKRRQLNHK